MVPVPDLVENVASKLELDLKVDWETQGTDAIDLDASMDLQ